jgi:hypothetical protein
MQVIAEVLGLRQRFVHDSHTAHLTDIIGTGVLTKPLAPSPVEPLANPVRDLYACGVY